MRFNSGLVVPSILFTTAMLGLLVSAVIQCDDRETPVQIIIQQLVEGVGGMPQWTIVGEDDMLSGNDNYRANVCLEWGTYNLTISNNPSVFYRVSQLQNATFADEIIVVGVYEGPVSFEIEELPEPCNSNQRELLVYVNSYDPSGVEWVLRGFEDYTSDVTPNFVALSSEDNFEFGRVCMDCWNSYVFQIASCDAQGNHNYSLVVNGEEDGSAYYDGSPTFDGSTSHLITATCSNDMIPLVPGDDDDGDDDDMFMNDCPAGMSSKLDILIDADMQPEETSWQLLRLDEAMYEVIDSNNRSEGAGLCLECGTYVFEISDCEFNGLCCDNGVGQYAVLLNGTLLQYGSDFGMYQRVLIEIDC